MTIIPYPPSTPHLASQTHLPCQTQLKRTKSSSIDPTLEIISAVHPHLLDILRRQHATLLLRVSKAFYDDLVPSLYTNLQLDKNNVQGILEGIDLLKDLEVDRKRKALLNVKELDILDIEVLDRLLDLLDKPKDETGDCTTQQISSIFPNLDILKLPFNLLKSLNELTISSSTISIIQENDEEDIIKRPKRTLIDYSIIFSSLIQTKFIHIDLNEEIPSDQYWAYDCTLTKLLKNIPTIPTQEFMTKLKIQTILPKDRPERSYIPHNLSLPSTIHFKGDNLNNGDMAKVIRGHYDVHILKDNYPTIEYFVNDIQGVRGQLELLIEMQWRVDTRLVLPEEQGGILRQEEGGVGEEGEPEQQELGEEGGNTDQEPVGETIT